MRTTALVLWILLSLHAATALATPTIRIDLAGQGSTAQVVVGETVLARILASGIPAGTDGRGLKSMGFMVEYDPIQLFAMNPALGPLWLDTGNTGSLIGPGLIGLLSNHFSPTPTTTGPFGDEILLANIDFVALTPGVHVLTLSQWAVNQLFDGTTLDGDMEYFDGMLVAVVPEPRTPLLILIGLGLLSIGRPATAELEQDGLERQNGGRA